MFVNRRITTLKRPYIGSNTNIIVTVFKIECKEMIRCIWSYKRTRVAKTVLQEKKGKGRDRPVL